jgi:hypothetical protein
MNGLTKSFIVVNFIFSIFFVVGVTMFFSQRTKWKGRAQKSKQIIERLTEENMTSKMVNEAKLIAQQNLVDSFPPQIDTLAIRNGMLNQKLQEVTLLLNREQSAKASLEKAKNKLSAQIDALVESKKKLGEQVALLVTKVTEAVGEKRKTISALAKAEKNVLQLEKSYATVLIMVKDQQAELDRSYQMIKAYQVRFPDIGPVNVVPFKGTVTAVSENVLAVNGGKNSKLEQGMTLTILREGRVICRVKLGTVQENQAFGIIKNRIKGEEPRKGDDVQSLPFGQ